MIIGSHVSFGKEQLLGSVKEAILYKADTFMFYTGAPQNTIRKSIDMDLVNKAKDLMKENNINIDNVICHAPYIVNPATKDIVKQEFAINFIKEELHRCNMMGIKRMVLHPGSAVGEEREEGLNNIVNVLNRVLDNDYDVTILIETMAGKGNEMGTSIEEIKYILDNVKYKEKLGVCLDTCHLNDAGIDINNFNEYLDSFNKLIGIKKIGCIHLNDSKNIRGSHKDRHENIGMGTIGFDDLSKVFHNDLLSDLPFILETPYVSINDTSKDKVIPPYKYEIDMLRNNKFIPKFIDIMRNDYSTKS